LFVVAAHGFSHSEFFLIFVKASALFEKVFRFIRQYVFLAPLSEIKICFRMYSVGLSIEFKYLKYFMTVII